MEKNNYIMNKKNEYGILRLFKNTSKDSKYNKKYYNVNGYNFMTNSYMILQLDQDINLKNILQEGNELNSFMEGYDFRKKDFSNMIEVDFNNAKIREIDRTSRSKMKVLSFNEYENSYSFNSNFINIVKAVLKKPTFYKDKDNEQVLYAKDIYNNYALILAMRTY